MKCRHQSARPVVGTCHAALALFALAGFAALPSGANAGTPVLFEQIVNQPFGVGMVEPTISADGRRVAFRTTANLTGQNADRSIEVFMYDRDTLLMKQITSTPGGSGTSITLPMITPDGTKVTCVSLWNFLTGTPGGTFQLWEVDVATGAYRQITNHPASTPVFEPRMSGDGRYFVYLGRINPTGENSNGSLEVFRVDRVSGATIQISDNVSTSATFQPDINGDGSVIVWADRANYDGTNTNGNQELWKWTDNGDGTTTRVSITNTTAAQAAENPKVDSSGRYVSFSSLLDFSGGTATGRKFFIVDTQTNVIRNLTSTGVGNSGFDVPDTEISPDGNWVYFESNRDLVTGSNLDGNRELFAYNVQSQTLSQLTATTGGVSISGFSDDATRRYVEIAGSNGNIVYRSDRLLDPTVVNDGANIDLFVGACAFAQVTATSANLDSGGTLDLSANVRISAASTFQWLKDGVAIADGAAGASVGGGTVSGASGAIAANGSVGLTISAVAASDAGNFTIRISGPCGDDIGNRITLAVNPPAPARCNPADIAYDDGNPLPPVGVAGGVNNGVTEGDYNLFFGQFFDAGAACDIANDDGSPLPPFGALATNNGVTEGDYNLFFSIFFDGCSL